MSGVEPCADCKWRLLLLRGKPTVILHCKTCRRWFVSSQVRTIDEGHIVAFTDGVKEHVNALLKCDAMAPHMVVGHINDCGSCAGEGWIDLNSEETFDKMLAEIARRGEGAYLAAEFPAYTLQHRCGADPRLAKLYLEIRPDAKEKVQKHLERRKRENEKFAKRHPRRSEGES